MQLLALMQLMLPVAVVLSIWNRFSTCTMLNWTRQWDWQGLEFRQQSSASLWLPVFIKTPLKCYEKAAWYAAPPAFAPDPTELTAFHQTLAGREGGGSPPSPLITVKYRSAENPTPHSRPFGPGTSALRASQLGPTVLLSQLFKQ